MADFTVIYSNNQTVNYTDAKWRVEPQSGVLEVTDSEGASAMYSPNAWLTVQYKRTGKAGGVIV